MDKFVTELEQLSIDTIRALAIDAIEAANSGHPGMPMGMAPVAYLLFQEVMNHDPANPAWSDRDRFILSAGHGSMLLYAALHLSGYDLSLDDLKQFRQFGSRTPGHPERDLNELTPGVEVTTGPLGQGFANGVGMAIAERFLRERYGDEVVNHRTYAIVSDGDLMEGVAAEAASLAGQLGLGRMIYLYDDNDISLDGPTSLSFDRENVTARFEAYGWGVWSVQDANDLAALRTTIAAAVADEERPSLIRVKSVIGYRSPNMAGKSRAHGAPLGAQEARLAKEAMGFDPEKSFYIPAQVADNCDVRHRGVSLSQSWQVRFDSWQQREPELAAEWKLAQQGKPLAGFENTFPVFSSDSALATRVAGERTMAAFADSVPTMVGGGADLASSTKTSFPEANQFTREKAGRNIFFGVREHAMAAAVNGIAAHGGMVCPYGSTFLQFADYMRPAIRLSALMQLPTVWVFTHDSIGLGEDGPTHQPVEHLAALRAIPGLTVIRPADANETAVAWRVAIEAVSGPTCLVLSRQSLPVLDQTTFTPATNLAAGAYILSDEENPQATILATGSEVSLALAAQELLAGQAVSVRVVSMPSFELFENQSDEYRQSIIDPTLPTLSVEAGIAQGWQRYADDCISLEHFGASAPADKLFAEFGFTAQSVAERVKVLLEVMEQWS